MDRRDMDRIEVLEDEFARRYNRKVEVWRDVFTKDKKFEKVVVDIRHDGQSYVLTEYFTPDQLTDYVTLDINDKCHRYKVYLEAEIQVADLIGAK